MGSMCLDVQTKPMDPSPIVDASEYLCPTVEYFLKIGGIASK